MAISTYAELKQAIQHWSKRTDSLSVLDDFIALTEVDIWENLRVRDMEARATATADARFLELPDSFLDMRRLVLTSGAQQYPLRKVSPESLTVFSSPGLPESFTTTTQIEFDRVPGASYTAEIHYYRSLTGLSSSNTTNAILTRFPNIYLYGCLFHLGQWARHSEMMAQYSSLFSGQIERANKLDRKGRHGPAPAMRTKAATP